jgi:hypothetical protein
MKNNKIIVLIIILLIMGGLIIFRDNLSSNLTQMRTNIRPENDEGQVVITLNELNNSGEAGQAIIKENNNSVTVTISLTGYKDEPQPSHLHLGSCDDLGAIKYPLTNSINGNSVTLINTTLAELKVAQPLAINIHESASQAVNFVACGDLDL